MTDQNSLYYGDNLDVLPLPAGVSTTGEVGIPASAISAVVDSSVTNFTIDP